MRLEKRWALAPNNMVCLTAYDDLSPGSGDRAWALLYYKHGWQFSKPAEKALKRIPLRWKLCRWLLKKKGV